MRRLTLAAAALCLTFTATPIRAQQSGQRGALRSEIDRLVAQVNPQVVAWRRDIHEHPELGNREFRTAALVAEHLRSLGMEVRTEVAHTGVVGILRGGRPGPTVALRADMDALPVTEMVDLPFASKVRTEYNGQEVGVMHACGTTTTWPFSWARPRSWPRCATGSPARWSSCSSRRKRDRPRAKTAEPAS